MTFTSKPKDTLPLWLLCSSFLLGYSAVGKEFSASQLKLLHCHKKLQPNISDEDVNQDKTLQPQHIFSPHFIPKHNLLVARFLWSFKQCLRSAHQNSEGLVQQLSRAAWPAQIVTVALMQVFRGWAHGIVENPEITCGQTNLTGAHHHLNFSALSENCLGILVSCNGRTIFIG